MLQGWSGVLMATLLTAITASKGATPSTTGKWPHASYHMPTCMCTQGCSTATIDTVTLWHGGTMLAVCTGSAGHTCMSCTQS